MKSMNHRGGWALIKASWASWMQQRGFFWLLAFGWMMPLLVYLFVWMAAAENGSISGLSKDQLAMYFLLLIPVNQLTYPQTNWTVGDVIRYGGIGTWFLRPMAAIYNVLSTEVAGKIVMMSFAVPITIILALVLRPQVQIEWSNALWFVPSLIMTWFLRFFWGYWLAELAFWTKTADSLLNLQDTLVFLLGGQLAPMVLLPDMLRRIANGLPFRYMLGFPVEILSGQLMPKEIITGLLFQFLWMAAAIVLQQVIWHRGVRHYDVVGG